MISPLNRLAAWSAYAMLSRLNKFPGRWRIERWALDHADLYNGASPRRVAMTGFDFEVHPSVSLDIYLNGTPRNSPVETILRTYVKNGDNTIDVGANIGWTARLTSALVGPSGKVTALEPLPLVFENLQRNVEAAPYRNIFPIAAAASDIPGEVVLYLPTSNATPLASLCAPEKGQTMVETRVQALTLDSLMDRIDPVSFVKIDVEGAEHKVLLGMEEILRRWRPVLALELTDAWLRKLGSSSQILIDHLHARNYDVLAYVDGKAMPLSTGPSVQVDVVCVPRD